MAVQRHSTGLAADVDVVLVMSLKLLWNFGFNACNALNYMGFAYNRIQVLRLLLLILT